MLSIAVTLPRVVYTHCFKLVFLIVILYKWIFVFHFFFFCCSKMSIEFLKMFLSLWNYGSSGCTNNMFLQQLQHSTQSICPFISIFFFHFPFHFVSFVWHETFNGSLFSFNNFSVSNYLEKPKCFGRRCFLQQERNFLDTRKCNFTFIFSLVKTFIKRV